MKATTRKLQFTKRHVLAILAGFAVITILSVISTILSSILFSHIISISHTSIEDMMRISSQQPYLSYRWILMAVSFLTPVVGGFLVGILVKEKGWIYGAILGIVTSVIALCIALIVFLPQNSTIPFSDFLVQALSTILKTTAGGYLGEFYLRRSRKPKH